MSHRYQRPRAAVARPSPLSTRGLPSLSARSMGMIHSCNRHYDGIGYVGRGRNPISSRGQNEIHVLPMMALAWIGPKKCESSLAFRLSPRTKYSSGPSVYGLPSDGYV